MIFVMKPYLSVRYLLRPLEIRWLPVSLEIVSPKDGPAMVLHPQLNKTELETKIFIQTANGSGKEVILDS